VKNASLARFARFRIRRPNWHDHPSVRSADQLTLGERLADRREDQISSELARHDFETNLQAEQMIEQIRSLTIEIHATVVPAKANDR